MPARHDKSHGFLPAAKLFTVWGANYLPAAHWVSGELGRRLFARLRSDADLSVIFGPDFKILSSLSVAPGATRVECERLILSVQHLPKLPYERQHRILLPVLEHILGELENKGLQGAASSSPRQGSFSMGQASSLSAARLGTTGFRVRSSLSITMVRGVPIGGGALCGKDPHKMDKCGALRARQLAKKLVGGGADEARVMLGWAPGGDDRW